MQSEVARLFERTSGAERPVAELTVVVPTFNERDNISEVASRLEQCLRGEAWEVIFVDDDSPDGTAGRIRELAQRDPRIRCLQRIGRRGLSSACVEGMLATSSPYLAVMEGDCQHDERVLPRMLELLKGGAADVVVGSRYISGGGIGSWNASRAKMSRFATGLGRAVIKHKSIRSDERLLCFASRGFGTLSAQPLEPRLQDTFGCGRFLARAAALERGTLRVS